MEAHEGDLGIDPQALEFGKFRFVKKPDIAGLTPEFVAKLYDFATEFGHLLPNAIKEFRSGEIEIGENTVIDLFLVADTKPNNRSLRVSRTANPEELEFIETVSGLILWDESLSVEEVEAVISQIDGITQKVIDTLITQKHSEN